jgi:hypothetical protein
MFIVRKYCDANLPADVEQFRPGVVLTAEGREPLSAAPHDRGSSRDRLDVVHGRGAAEEADVRGERRLQPRFALLSLDALDQGCFFAANVRSYFVYT